MRELVTIQVGGFANFIGSHFWNIQVFVLLLAYFVTSCASLDGLLASDS